MPNDLNIGTVRIGNLIDFDPDTPDRKVQLERTADSIRLTIPWDHCEDTYAAWFSAETLLSTKPAAETTGIPNRLMFADHNGSVMLLGCRVSQLNPIFFGAGLGIIIVEYAVFGFWGDLDLDNVESLRSEVSGLRMWAGLSSVDRDRASAVPATGPRTVTYTLKDGDPIDVGGPSGLRLVPSWHATDDYFSDETVLRNFAKVETSYLEPSAWTKHLESHYALRDLLTISSWIPETVLLDAVFKVDPSPSDDPTSRSGSWLRVIAAHAEEETAGSAPRMHLINYLDLRKEGLLRWLRLRTAFARAIDPFLVSALTLNPRISIELAQVCMGMEALAYLIVQRDDGATPKAAANMSIAARLERVGRPLADVIPFDVAEWAQSTADAYNAIKHANRTLSSDIDMLNRWRETVLVFRLWIAVELGVDRTALGHRIATDPMSEAYRLI